MRSSFAARRQPRKVGQDDDDGADSGGLGNQEQGTFSHQNIAEQMSNVKFGPHRLTASPESTSTPPGIRPSISSRSTSKSKKRSSVRRSFGPSGTSITEDDDGDGTPAVFTPKKSNLSRAAVEKNALRKSLVRNLEAEHLPSRPATDDRPSYSKDHLNELKISTPSTPKDLRSHSDAEDRESKALDLVAKFGSDLVVQDSKSAIPTDAEIREKKERRARLAKEQDFINLDDDDGNDAAGAEEDPDDSNDERSLLPYAQQKPSKKEETRLVRDDEDIAEGFDEFVSDGRIALGKKAQREQKKRQEADIRDLINEAEGGSGSDDSEDESEVERKAAYEAAQTQKGMDGLHRGEEEAVRPRRPRTPPRITPLPTLGGCVERLKGMLAKKQYELAGKERRLEAMRGERGDIKTRQEEVQRLLRETGERYERLRDEAREEPGLNGVGGVGQMVGVQGIGMGSRGLENFGEG